ncbi:MULTISPECIES: hypothetical protein [unclassified Blastococcus]
MEYLRQLQYERPVLFWVLVAVGVFVGFQLLLFVVQLILPVGLPSWLPIALVLGGLVLVARRQQRP